MSLGRIHLGTKQRGQRASIHARGETCLQDLLSLGGEAAPPSGRGLWALWGSTGRPPPRPPPVTDPTCHCLPGAASARPSSTGRARPWRRAAPAVPAGASTRSRTLSPDP